MDMGEAVKEQMAARAAEELKKGMLVNLGIGIPTLVANYVTPEQQITFHAENGIVGAGGSPPIGQEDGHLCNAGGYPITLERGGVYVDSATAFAIIRSGRLDVTILGALQVSEAGDLSNWIVPGKHVPGIGGAMELAAKAKRVIVVMNHVSRNGEPKILKKCTYPLTAARSVDLLITDMAVIECKAGQLHLTEVFAPYTIEDVIKYTEAPLHIQSEQIIYRKGGGS